MDVECPACGAKVGEPCKTLTDKTMHGFDTKRRNAALAKVYPSEAVNNMNNVSGRIARDPTEGK
jgi:hypothetical protein